MKSYSSYNTFNYRQQLIIPIRSQYPYSVYWYDWTHPEALKRRRQARHYRRQRNSHLVRYMEAKLKVQWSPEEIAQRIRIDYPEDEKMRISHETIYRWIYLDASGGGELYQNLRRRRKRHHRQKRYGPGRRFLAGRKNIADNGSEFAQFKKIEEKTGLTVYFADPYSAWQREANENTNGLLRILQQ